MLAFGKIRTLSILILVFASLIGCSVLGPVESRFTGHIPYAAKTLANAIDEQLMMRFANVSEDSDTEQIPEKNVRASILVMGTTAVNVNNLQKVCPLSRQMTEELSTRLVHMGYRYEELRKGKDIRFDRVVGGELILTRSVKELSSRYGRGQAILAGTYVISKEDVRFTYSLISPQTNEVIAKTSATVPITADIEPLLDESPVGNTGGGRIPNTYIWLR